MLCFIQASAAKKRTWLTGRRQLTECVTLDSRIAGSSRDRSCMPGFAALSVLSRTAEKATTSSYIVTPVLGVNASSFSTDINDQNELSEMGAD